jgi:holo-[acyl-carrier protein] synthase
MTHKNNNKQPDKIEVIGLGTDIIEVERIKAVIDKRGNKFLNRIYTQNEIDYCQQKKRSVESYAARFSAKEAFVKAIESDYTIPYKEIEILKKESHKPKVSLSGNAQLAAEEKNVTEILVSLSHQKSYATANIILKGRVK